MMDTYSINMGRTIPDVVTGKPISLGGSLGRKDATGRGVFVTASLAAKKLNIPIQDSRVVIQGFGNVGNAAARAFFDDGARIIAVSDVTGAIRNDAGINAHDLLNYSAETNGIKGFPRAEPIHTNELLTTPCDFLIPAALEGQITEHNAAKLQTKIIVEGANGPTTPQADDILRERNILVIPDVIATAGGVTVSYFEWVQDFSSFFWTEKKSMQGLLKF
jgi:glutamate dehydrogenase (NAD(P)+)